jgi:hypothetical protein
VRSRADFDILKYELFVCILYNSICSPNYTRCEIAALSCRVSPVAAAEHVKIPAIVLTAENDEIVHSSLSTHVYDALKVGCVYVLATCFDVQTLRVQGPKVQIVFQGTHNRFVRQFHCLISS